jgi:hypothetical protein
MRRERGGEGRRRDGGGDCREKGREGEGRGGRGEGEGVRGEACVSDVHSIPMFHTLAHTTCNTDH